MSESFTWNSFAGGWQPSVDAINGPKGCLLQMDNLELDKTGSLSLIGGTTVVGSAYTYNAHTLFSAILVGTRYDYVADVNGTILRDGFSIATGGSSTNAAFSVAYYWVLACSGSTRIKNNYGNVVFPLGLTTPEFGYAVVDGIVTADTFSTSVVSFVQLTGTTGSIVGLGFADVEPSSSTLVWAVQSYNGTPVSEDSTVLGGLNSLSTFIPYTYSEFDFFRIDFTANGPLLGSTDLLENVSSITFNVLLAPTDNVGTVVTDYFTYTYNNPGGLISRSDFVLAM